MFLFGLGDHHYRHFGVQALHLLERLESGHTRHVFIQEDNGRHRFRQAVQGIFAIRGSRHVIAFAFEVNDIRLQEIYLIINPEYLAHNVSIY